MTIKCDHGLWSHNLQKIFEPQLRLIVRTLETRILPGFDNLEEEANAIYEDALSKLNPYTGSGDEDFGDLDQQAEQAGVSYYIDQYNVRQGVLNLFAVFLFHCFEQQLIEFLRHEMPRSSGHATYSQKELKLEFLKLGINIERFRSWKLIKEIQLAANVVKHAAGGSADSLHKLRPELFVNPGLRDYPEIIAIEPIVVRTLSGEDFYISLNDLEKWRDATIDFWGELLEAIRGSGA